HSRLFALVMSVGRLPRIECQHQPLAASEAFKSKRSAPQPVSINLGKSLPTNAIVGGAIACCARRKRPRCRAAERRDKRAPFHSITSSARSRIDVGTDTPIA